eukprot:2584730-Prymnesium_polylepis.2
MRQKNSGGDLGRSYLEHPASAVDDKHPSMNPANEKTRPPGPLRAAEEPGSWARHHRETWRARHLGLAPARAPPPCRELAAAPTQGSPDHPQHRALAEVGARA